MEQNYELLAQSRANYYTAGSPVQFVRVELLKGDVTGEIVVCLTFKNISPEVLSGLVIKFKCKTPTGEVLCEDQFYYENLSAKQGELFGADDAVYISAAPIGSVEVELDRAFQQGGSAVLLGQYRRVRLPAPKLLPPQLSKRLEESTGKTGMTVVPQIIEDGWYCACGAFHCNEEDSVYCSECGCDRILLQNSLTNILKEVAPRAAAEVQQTEVIVTEEPTQAVPMTDQERFEAEYRRRNGGAAPVANEVVAPPPAPDATMTMSDLPAAEEPVRTSYSRPPRRERYRDEYDTQDYEGRDEDEDDEETDDDMKVVGGVRSAYAGRYAEGSADAADDEMAEKIIRFAPPITAVLCAIVVAVGIIIHFVG